MTELLVGTKKGLFVLEGGAGAEFGITARGFAGLPVEYALRGRRPGRALREPRRRRDLGAQPGALGAPDATQVGARRRRPLPAHGRAMARRSEAPGGRGLSRRRLADRGRRRVLGTRQ